MYVKYITDRARVATKSDRKKTSYNSIKCRICTCRIDTVRLAQPNRSAKEAAAQKEAVKFVVRPFDQIGRDVF